MDRKSLQRLRIDRRLIRRRSWISPQELQQELDALPDVSHKIAPEEEADSETQPAPAGPGAPPPVD